MSLTARTADFLNKPETINTICDDIASGGSIIDICETMQIRYCDVMRWINSDNDRKKEYAQSITDRGEWYVQRIIKELHGLGFADFKSMFDEKGNLLPPDKLPKEVTRWINSIDIVETPTGATIKKLKFESKIRALELLGKNLFMFVDRQVVMNGNADDANFRDEFFGLGKKKQGSPTTGAVKIL